MKKMIKNLMLVAVAAMAFVGCQNDNDEMNVTVKKTVFEFTANIEETTRSYFGEKEDGIYPTLWEGGEMVSLVVLNSADEIVATAHSTVEAEEGAAEAKITATFEGELVNAAKLVAYIGSWDFNRTLDLDEQFASKVGKVNHTLISENTWDGAKAVVLNFSHAVAYGNMTINDSPIELSKLSKVIVALDEVEYSISIGDELESLNIWFACDADEDFETFKVSLVADNGVTYSKSVDMTEYAADKRLKFIKGHVSKFSISGFEKVAADHAVEFTKMAGPVSEDFGSWAGVGMKYTFSNDAGDTMQITFSEADGNPLKAGTYTNSSKCEDGYFYGNGTWIKLAGADYETYISSGDVVVALEDDVYTVTYTGTIAGETYETTFTGNVTVWESFEGQWYNDTNYGIWATTVSGDVFFFDMYCDSSVGHVIPEGTYTYGWTRPSFSNSTVNSVSITDGTVTVAHLESGYKIDINVTDANSNNFEYSFSGIVALRDANNAFKNPPIEYKDITVDAEMATVTASYDKGSAFYGYGDSYALYITTAEFEGETYYLTLHLRIPIEESSNGLIPANTYTLGAEDYTLTSESTGDSVKFANAELVVGHNTETGVYTLTFTGENLMKTKFNLTYAGKIAKADENNDFRNPGDKAKLERPNVSAEFNSTTEQVNVSWSSIANADHYEVSVNEAEAVSVNGTTYSFDADYGTSYNITVVAAPTVDSTLYTNSDAGSTSITTPTDFSADGDYNVTLTKITNIEGNKYTFKGDNDKDRLILAFNSGISTFEAGRYALVWGDYGSSAKYIDGNNSSFNFNGSSQASDYNVSGEMNADIVEITINDGVYTMVAMLHCGGELVKYTYTGAWEITTDDEGGEGEVAATTFNYYGRWDNYYGLTSKSSGVYKLIGENFEIDLAIHYTGYNQTTGALVPGTYTYSYNAGYYPGNGSGYDADDYMYGGNFSFAGTLNGEALKNNYDSTLVVTDSGITLTVMVDYAPAIVITAGQPTVPGAEPQQLDTPTGLVATPDVNTVTVNWNAVANAESYDVTCGVNKLTVEGTTATFDGLEADATYEISVVAKADGYEDSPAATTTVTTLPAAVEPDSIVLTTITPLNETYDPGYYTWSFNFTDGTDNNKFAIAFFYNKASATSIVPGEYTFASELGQVNATNFALDGRNPYYFEGINKKLTTGSTVNVAVDGSVYTINMHFILSDGSEHNYKYVGEIVVEEPEPEPETLATPTGLVATPDVNEVTVSWSAVENAETYYVTCGDKSPQTVTTTTATFTGLTANTEYTITVVAKADGYTDSLAASIPVTTKADAGGEGEAKQVSLTFFTDNGTSYIFKGNDGHNYLIAFRNYNPGTFSLTDNTKFIATHCTWTDNNTTYYGGTQFAEGDTLELINLGGAYKIIIRATVDGEPVVATCDSTTFS